MEFSDKLVHFVEFMVFGWLIWRSARRWPLNLNTTWLIIAAFGIGALYAASDEYHQTFVPGRYGHILDWTADSIGLLAGITTAYLFTERKGKSTPNT